MLKAIQNSWRGYKSRTKALLYSAYEIDEERRAHKPDNIPEEDFNVLLEYWGHPEIQVNL